MYLLTDKFPNFTDFLFKMLILPHNFTVQELIVYRISRLCQFNELKGIKYGYTNIENRY